MKKLTRRGYTSLLMGQYGWEYIRERIRSNLYKLKETVRNCDGLYSEKEGHMAGPDAESLKVDLESALADAEMDLILFVCTYYNTDRDMDSLKIGYAGDIDFYSCIDCMVCLIDSMEQNRYALDCNVVSKRILKIFLGALFLVYRKFEISPDDVDYKKAFKLERFERRKMKYGPINNESFFRLYF